MSFEVISKVAQQGGTLYFGLLFLLVAGWVFLPRNKKTFERAARMALDEDDQ